MNKISSRKRRVTARSVIAGLLCAGMMIGSTWAWFSDSASTGTNKVVAGNLKIGLQYRNEDAEDADEEGWADATKPDVKLFDDVELWEPGAVTYEEFRVSNLGSLAAKYAFYLDDSALKHYCIIDKNTGDDAESYPYIVTDKSLGDVLYVACYPGTFSELVEEVNTKLELGEDKKYTVDSIDKNREVVMKAIETGILPLEDDLDYDEETAKGTFGPLMEGDINDGSAWSYGALIPHGETYSGETPWKYSFLGNVAEVDGGYREIEHPSDKDELTVIICWLPDHMKIQYGDPELSEWYPSDNDYNMKDGRCASNIPIGDGGDELYGMAEANCNGEEQKWEEVDDEDLNYTAYKATEDSLKEYFSDDGLHITFAVGVFATQVEYESDSFGNKYDEYVWPSNEVEGPPRN